jgi:hypothetical protein
VFAAVRPKFRFALATRRSMASDVHNGKSPRNAFGFPARVFAIGKSASAIGAFVVSRRWILGAILATGGLLAILTIAHPKRQHFVNEPDAQETEFDDVKRLGIATGSSGSWFRRGADVSGGENGKSSNRVDGLTLGSPPADESEPPESSSVTRRLDAVRARQARGAWLTGGIDSTAAAATKPVARQSSNAPLRPPAQTQPTKTADSRSGPLHSTPESVFR